MRPSAIRSRIEAFLARHPKKPDLRLFICRLYLHGEFSGENFERSRKERRIYLLGKDPREPQPDKIIPVAQQLLKENPKNWTARYYLARAYRLKRQDKEALAHFKAVADEPTAPEPFRSVAQAFVKEQSDSVFPRLKLVE